MLCLVMTLMKDAEEEEEEEAAAKGLLCAAWPSDASNPLPYAVLELMCACVYLCVCVYVLSFSGSAFSSSGWSVPFPESVWCRLCAVSP